jgi:hypothetical protein
MPIYNPGCAKIDDEETNGLLGVSNSLAYRVGEVERHLHSNESWFGAAVTPNGEIHIADRIGDTTTPLVVDAGNNTWGSWTQILGSNDTPARSGMAKFDLHRIEFAAAERSGIHFVQITFGDVAATAFSAGYFTEFVFYEPVGGVISEPVPIQVRRYSVGTKVWMRVYIPTQNTGTISFYLGFHEYEG